MILHLGLRTDVVQYYSEWFLNRLREGYCFTRNPLFPNKVTRYTLSPQKVDAIILCSKNYAPLLPRVREISDKYNTLFYYTITAYGKDVEPNVPSIDESIQTLKELSAVVGKRKLIWRYDPVLLTKKYTVETHFETFARIAEEIAPYVSRCIFTFVEMFIKIRTFMPELIPLTEEQKEALAEGLGRIAADCGIPIQTCGEGGDYTRFGIERTGCTTLPMIGRANGVSFRDAPHNGNYRGCMCYTCRDVGWYDSCPNGCKYCNANHNGETVAENYALHDPNSPLLIGNVKEGDILFTGNQRDSLIRHDSRQLSLFEP